VRAQFYKSEYFCAYARPMFDPYATSDANPTQSFINEAPEHKKLKNTTDLKQKKQDLYI